MPFRRLKIDNCAIIGGIPKVFDSLFQQCLLPATFHFHQAASAAGSSRVGDSCAYNTDCLTGMYCDAGLCACMSNYVQYDKYCYESKKKDSQKISKSIIEKFEKITKFYSRNQSISGRMQLRSAMFRSLAWGHVQKGGRK